MNFFDQLENIEYEGNLINNFFFSYKVPPSYYKAGYFNEYRISNGDRIESIAKALYGDDKLYWILLLYNNIIDPYNELPLDNFELETLCEIISKQRFGNDYSDLEFEKTLNELFEINEGKRILKIPFKSTVEGIKSDISAYILAQRK